MAAWSRARATVLARKYYIGTAGSNIRQWCPGVFPTANKVVEDAPCSCSSSEVPLLNSASVAFYDMSRRVSPRAMREVRGFVSNKKQLVVEVGSAALGAKSPNCIGILARCAMPFVQQNSFARLHLTDLCCRLCQLSNCFSILIGCRFSVCSLGSSCTE